MKRAIWVVPAVVAAVLVVPTAAHASCAEPVPLEQALAGTETVFVGTVTTLDFHDRVATVAVDEVWKGEPGAVVTVSGGGPVASLAEARKQGQETFTSVDRTYVAGTRYLFVPHAIEQGAFMDTQCSNTQPYGPGLDAFRPADARIVAPPAGGGGNAALWIGLGSAALALAAAGAIWLLGRRRVAAAAG